MKAVLAAALAGVAMLGGSTACVTPTGIDDGLPGSVTTADLATLPEDNIFATAIQTGLATSPGLGSYETPIQFKLIQNAVTSIYSTAAAFHPTALEYFGREAESEDRRRCQDGDAELLAKHRRLTLAYAVVWGMSEFIPEFKAPLTGVFESWGLDIERCTGDDALGCTTTSTPWGLARTLVNEARDFASRDGWNADGSLSRSNNKMPYQDWRDEPYCPVNSPWFLSRRRRWQPLLERDTRGFFYHQEHVVPHIGETARSILQSDEEICARRAPKPHYNLRHEAQLALERTGALNDRTKAEVEFFDSKLTSVVPLQVQYYARKGVSLDSFEFIQADTATIVALYESVIVSWREKVRHDLVRPTSFIHHKFKGDDVFSYAGPNAGAQTIKGDEWEPYIRVMPHAEYPSGSSCVCKAFQRVMEILTGTDDVTGDIGGPLAHVAPANSSRLETAKPAADETFLFNSWSEIATRCGVSRLNGGMHFTASVPAGEDLCGSIGDTVANAYVKMAAGERPDYIVDFDAPASLRQERC